MGARQRLAVLAAALWWGSLTAIGGLAVPLLFSALPTPALAGQVAARLFAAQTWVSVGCGLVLLLASRPRDEADKPAWAGAALVFVLGGLLLALVNQYGVSPRIVARQNLAVWHTVGSTMYALQWACALVVLWRVTGKPRT
jgi:cytosine/uracil/thiamine/allantoin permease